MCKENNSSKDADIKGIATDIHRNIQTNKQIPSKDKSKKQSQDTEFEKTTKKKMPPVTDN